MIENLSDYVFSLLLKYKLVCQENYSDVEYIIRLTIFAILSTLPLILLNWWFGTIQELVVITIVFNTLRTYSGGFHASLGNCIKLTIPLITITCFVASNTSQYASIFFIIALIIGFYITTFVSIENKKYYLFYLIIFMVGSLIFDNMGYSKIANSVYMSILLIHLMLNKYTIKFFQWIDSKL